MIICLSSWGGGGGGGGGTCPQYTPTHPPMLFASLLCGKVGDNNVKVYIASTFHVEDLARQKI